MNVKRKLAFIAKLTGFILLLGMLTACDQNGQIRMPCWMNVPAHQITRPSQLLHLMTMGN